MAKKTNITIAVTEKELAALNYCVHEFTILAQSDISNFYPVKNKHLKRANKVINCLIERYNLNNTNLENENNQHTN